jgi:hypothetical protein
VSISVTLAPQVKFRLSIADIQCAGRQKRCRRQVTWRVLGEGYFCNGCFDQIFAIRWRDIDIADIRRLSDDESDFFYNSGM